MSHALDMSSGKAAIAYAGEMPWHGMGQKINDGMTLHQMRVAAGLNWEVQELEPFYNFTPKATRSNPTPQVQQRSVPNRKALVRSDNGNWLSQMSENKYNVRQPKEIVEFFRDICEAGGFKITTLGALNEGRKVWCQAERVGGASELSALIKPTILLADSYDGSMATIAQFSTTTVVCANTLAMARGEGGAVKVPHSKQFDADKVKEQLGAIDGAFKTFLDNMHLFSQVKMTPDFKERYFLKLFGALNTDAKKEGKHFFGAQEGKGSTWKRAKIDRDQLSKVSQGVVKRLMELSEEGNAPGSEFFAGTLYNALQTVTYYQDHEARSWGEGRRWESAMLGNGADNKSNALDLALELIK